MNIDLPSSPEEKLDILRSELEPLVKDEFDESLESKRLDDPESPYNKVQTLCLRAVDEDGLDPQKIIEILEGLASQMEARSSIHKGLFVQTVRLALEGHIQ